MGSIRLTIIGLLFSICTYSQWGLQGIWTNDTIEFFSSDRGDTLKIWFAGDSVFFQLNNNADEIFINGLNTSTITIDTTDFALNVDSAKNNFTVTGNLEVDTIYFARTYNDFITQTADNNVTINSGGSVMQVQLNSINYGDAIIRYTGGVNDVVYAIENTSVGLAGTSTGTDQLSLRVNSTNKITIKDTVIYIDSSIIEKMYSGEYNVTYDPATGSLLAHELPHGFIGFEDSAVSLTLTSNSVWYHVTNATGTLYDSIEGYDVTYDNDTIILGDDGHYQFHFHISGEGGNGVNYFLRLYNVTQGENVKYKTSATGRGSGNNVTIGNTGYCTNCEAGDRIILQMRSGSNTQTFQLEDGSILIILTHAE